AKKKIPYCVNITGLGTAFQNDGMTKKTIILLYKKALKRVKTVFFENPENRDIFLNNGIITKDKTHVLNGAGVNIKEYPFKPYPKNTETRFLFIGRVMKEKGIDEFLTVAKRIKQENENTFFDILGVMEDNYRDVIASYEAEGIVKYHGLQEDVRPFIEKSHCFVLPSYHEGMANTLLECGAMGRPLITSNIHGCLEAVMDGETGYLCKVKDADDLYEKMKKFIGLPYEKKEEMGRLSHEYIAKVFDKRKVVEETISVIMK
ncbi:MAG: glycosyltransferase, partial [Clostridia bacterium]|nr:glycosyltransferase [Clostridia bacterium]